MRNCAVRANKRTRVAVSGTTHALAVDEALAHLVQGSYQAVIFSSNVEGCGLYEAAPHANSRSVRPGSCRLCHVALLARSVQRLCSLTVPEAHVVDEASAALERGLRGRRAAGLNAPEEGSHEGKCSLGQEDFRSWGKHIRVALRRWGAHHGVSSAAPVLNLTAMNCSPISLWASGSVWIGLSTPVELVTEVE